MMCVNDSKIQAAVDISAHISAGDGTLTLIQAGRDFTGSIAGNAVLATLYAGRDIAGTAGAMLHASAINTVTAGRDITTVLDATGGIGEVDAGRGILGNIIAETGAINTITTGVWDFSWGNYSRKKDQFTVSGAIGRRHPCRDHLRRRHARRQQRPGGGGSSRRGGAAGKST